MVYGDGRIRRATRLKKFDNFYKSDQACTLKNGHTNVLYVHMLDKFLVKFYISDLNLVSSFNSYF